jgi:Zn-dependent M28 family amino/carboxypeptidase
MYILGAHMDGRGFGEATDDNGSGAALVMELARVLSGPDVVTERSISRFGTTRKPGSRAPSPIYRNAARSKARRIRPDRAAIRSPDGSP